MTTSSDQLDAALVVENNISTIFNRFAKAALGVQNPDNYQIVEIRPGGRIRVRNTAGEQTFDPIEELESWKINSPEYREFISLLKGEKWNTLSADAILRLRSELSVSAKNIISPPSEAPQLYIPRSGVKASEFLLIHYGIYLVSGTLFRPMLKKIDRKLEKALANEFEGRTEELRKLLPTKQDAMNKLLLEVAQGIASPEDRDKIMHNMTRLATVRLNKTTSPK